MGVDKDSYGQGPAEENSTASSLGTLAVLGL